MSKINDLLTWRLFERRLEKSREALYRMAFAWCHNRDLAEDLTQQTLVKALEKRNQLRELDKLERWVFQILANALRDWYRRERPTEAIEDHEPVEVFSPERGVMRDEVVTRVREAIARLPLAQCQVVTLIDLEGLSYADVAEVLDIPIGTVMSRLSRARKSLAAQLDETHRRPDTDKAAAKGQLRRVV